MPLLGFDTTVSKIISDTKAIRQPTRRHCTLTPNG